MHSIHFYLRSFALEARQIWQAVKERRVLTWCLAAMVLGFLLRLALCAKMPYAFYHADCDQVFDTYQRLGEGSLDINVKKTWLGPLVYCIPGLFRLPILPSIAITQHLLGLVTVILAGITVAFSFSRWRIFIIPATVAVALNPDLLWYEHVALPETLYVLFVVSTALTGLAYVRRPSLLRLLLLGVSIFLAASSRPEGQLFCIFGVALCMTTQWKNWPLFLRDVGALLGFSIVSLAVNRTDQGGSLLYSNVAHLTPSRLLSAPGFAEKHSDYFSRLRQDWAVVPQNIPRERKQLYAFARDYLTHGKEPRSLKANEFCGRIGAEVCLRNLVHLPSLALTKFRFALRRPVAGDFGPEWVWIKQFDAFTGGWEEGEIPSEHTQFDKDSSQLVFGREFHTAPELQNHLHDIYKPFTPDWLSAYQRWYSESVQKFSLPDHDDGKVMLCGMPFLYLTATLGLILMAISSVSYRSYHILWLGMLVLMAFVLALTGSNLGRFRIVFEPFWFIYTLGLCDAVATIAMKRIPRWQIHSAPKTL